MEVMLNALLHGGDKIDSRSRHGRGIDIGPLANSIRRLGLILPLAVVQEGEKYRVVDGNRRLEALKQIHKGEKDVRVPVLVHETVDGAARALSLAANIERLPLHPVDQHEAFAALAKDGMALAEVAAAFGIGERQVRQQMALGALAPEVRSLYRQGNIDVRAARALTRVPVDEQARLVSSGEPMWRIAAQIEQQLSGEALSPATGLARFVGREAYQEAGGGFVCDLFIDEDKQLWKDADIAGEIANRKLDELRAAVLADGWSFFEITDTWWSQGYVSEYAAGEPGELTIDEQAAIEQLEDEQATIVAGLEAEDEDDPDHNDRVIRLREIEDKVNAILDEVRTYTAEQKGRLGVVIDANYDIRDGVSRRAGSRQAEAKPPEKKEAAPHSGAVTMDLDAALTVACKAALAADPALTLRLLALSWLERHLIFGLDPSHAGINIMASGGNLICAEPDHRLAEIESLVKSVKLSKAKDFEAKMKAMEKIDDAGIMLILGFFTARSLAVQHRGRELVLLLDKRKQLKIAEHFTPDAENFFGRLTKAQLEMLLAEASIERDLGPLKKAEAVELVMSKLPEGWLPEAMRPRKPD